MAHPNIPGGFKSEEERQRSEKGGKMQNPPTGSNVPPWMKGKGGAKQGKSEERTAARKKAIAGRLAKMDKAQGGKRAM